MPWKETCRMDEKLCFVADCLRGELPIAALCEDYGISRKTAYKWLGRYREGGPAGLLERSRAPHRHGRSMAPGVADAIVALRRDRPHWGPRKLRAALMRFAPRGGVAGGQHDGRPVARGRVGERAPPSPPPGPGPPGRSAQPARPTTSGASTSRAGSATRNGERCDPLTVSDAYSRYLLACAIVPPRTEAVRPVLDQLFRRHGLPLAMRSDNGRAVRRSGCGRAVAALRRLGQGPASRWSGSSRASPSRTDATSACIGP